MRVLQGVRPTPPDTVAAWRPLAPRPTAGRSALGQRGRRALRGLVLFALAVSGGCGGHGGTTPATLPLRTDVEWQLESLEPPSGPAVQVTDPSLYTVRFGANGTLAARADCNRCAGPYRVSGTSLTVGPLACTLAACPMPTLGDQVTGALTGVTSYDQTTTELILTGAGGTLHFRPRP
jgi:heat shock protein HslJ